MNSRFTFKNDIYFKLDFNTNIKDYINIILLKKGFVSKTQIFDFLEDLNIIQRKIEGFIIVS